MDLILFYPLAINPLAKISEIPLNCTSWQFANNINLVEKAADIIVARRQKHQGMIGLAKVPMQSLCYGQQS